MAWVSAASDDFNRTETPMAGNWTTITSETAFNLNGSAAVPSSLASDCGARWNARTWTANQASEGVLLCSVGGGGSGAGIGLTVRTQSAARTYYRMVVDHGSPPNNGELRKFVAGASTQLQLFSVTWTDSDTWMFTVEGPTSNAVLSVYRNSSLETTYTDTSSTVPASGSPGISYSSTEGSASISAWAGYEPDPVTPPTIIDYRMHPRYLRAGRRPV